MSGVPMAGPPSGQRTGPAPIGEPAAVWQGGVRVQSDTHMAAFAGIQAPELLSVEEYDKIVAEKTALALKEAKESFIAALTKKQREELEIGNAFLWGGSMDVSISLTCNVDAKALIDALNVHLRRFGMCVKDPRTSGRPRLFFIAEQGVLLTVERLKPRP